jgi:hypothetical protein
MAERPRYKFFEVQLCGRDDRLDGYETLSAEVNKLVDEGWDFLRMHTRHEERYDERFAQKRRLSVYAVVTMRMDTLHYPKIPKIEKPEEKEDAL